MSDYEHLSELHRDKLTSLPNQRAFQEALEKAITTHPGNFAIMKVDILGFKPVNDTYGHADGDEHIKIVAEVLDEFLRSNDLHLPAREQGDEFSVILYGVTTKEQLGVIGERVRTELAEEYGIDISIGTCIHAEDINAIQLQALADTCRIYDRRKRKIEQYGGDPERVAAIYEMARLAILHNINPRDTPTLFQLVEDGHL